MIFLKQSTATDVMLGPFVDDTDGKTTEEALTLAQADLHLSKNGGSSAQKNDTTSATHRYGGNYSVPLNATDTDTLGNLRLMCKKTGALPVVADFMVVPANVYDSMVGGSDNLEVDATLIEGSDATNQINAACDTALTDYDAVVPADLPTNFADLAITASTGRVTVETNNDKTGYSISGTKTTLDDLNDVSTAQVNAEVDTALSDYDPPTKAEMDAKIDALNDLSAAQVNAEVDTAIETYGLDHLVSASVAGADVADNSIIAQMVSKSATADWDSFDNTTDSLEASADSGGGGPTAADIADAVWDEARADHVSAGSFGEGVKVESLNTQAKADVNAEADTALTDYDAPTKAEMDAGFAALNDLSAAEVNAEVDTALTDYDPPTKAELDAGLAALNDPDTASIADAVWDEATVGHTTAGTFGEQVKTDVDAILADTNELQQDDVPGLIGALNDLSAAEVNAEVDTALSDYDPPTKAELDAGLSALNDPDAATVAGAVWDEARADHVAAGSFGEGVKAESLNTQAKADVNAEVDTALTDYDPPKKAELDSGLAGLNDLSAAEVNAQVDAALSDYDPPTKAELDSGLAALNDISVSDILTTAMTESYNADGFEPTLAQALYVIMQRLVDFEISGTTISVKGLDGTTEQFTLTLDDATTPTSSARSS